MKCVYPGCRASVEEENSWCADHQAVTCNYPLHEPLCQERPLPHSGYCLEHDKMVGFFINLHNEVHKQAAAAQAAAKQQEAIINRAKVHLLNGR